MPPMSFFSQQNPQRGVQVSKMPPRIWFIQLSQLRFSCRFDRYKAEEKLIESVRDPACLRDTAYTTQLRLALLSHSKPPVALHKRRTSRPGVTEWQSALGGQREVARVGSAKERWKKQDERQKNEEKKRVKQTSSFIMLKKTYVHWNVFSQIRLWNSSPPIFFCPKGLS